MYCAFSEETLEVLSQRESIRRQLASETGTGELFIPDFSRKNQPNNIPEQSTEVVQKASANICEAAVRRRVGNFRRRVNLCFRNKGRCFEYEL